MATAGAEVLRGHQGPWWTHLYVQVLTAIAIGILLGHFYPQTGVATIVVSKWENSLDEPRMQAILAKETGYDDVGEPARTAVG